MNKKEAEEAIKHAVNGAAKNKKENKLETNVDVMSPNMENLIKLTPQTARTCIAVIDGMAKRGAILGEELEACGILRRDAAQLINLAEAVSSEIATVKENSK